MTYMPNIIFSCQTTLKKAKFLEFGLKNANVALATLSLNEATMSTRLHTARQVNAVHWCAATLTNFLHKLTNSTGCSPFKISKHE